MTTEHLNKKTEEKETPRIYVSSLADYNAGRHHGRWIDADQSIEDIRREVAELLAESKEFLAEDWAIHDYENFGSLRLSEFEDLEFVAEVVRLMGEHGTLFAELVAHFGGRSGVDEARRYIEEGYCGEFDKLEHYAEELLDDCYGDALKSLPDFIRYHIDYEGIARDSPLRGSTSDWSTQCLIASPSGLQLNAFADAPSVKCAGRRADFPAKIFCL